MNDTIKEAVLALAETDPELAAELAKESTETTTAGPDGMDVVMQLVRRIKSTDYNNVRFALDKMGYRRRAELVRTLKWFDDSIRDFEMGR